MASSSLAVALAALLANGDSEGARQVCVSQVTAHAYAALNQAFADAAREQLTDVVQLMCTTPEVAAHLQADTIGHVILDFVWKPPATAQTAAILRSVFAIATVWSTNPQLVRMMMRHVASVEWMDGLEACCADTSLGAAVTRFDLEDALRVALGEGRERAVRLLCSTRLLAFGVQPLRRPSLLLWAAKFAPSRILALLGEVVAWWPPSYVQEALAAAARSDRVCQVRILCAPPFAAQVWGATPSPLVAAAEEDSNQVVAALLAMLPVAGDPAAAAASHDLALTVQGAVEWASVDVLRQCLSHLWRVRADLSPVDLVRSSARTLSKCLPQYPFVVARCATAMLACLRTPGGDWVPQVTLRALLATVEAAAHKCDVGELRTLVHEVASLALWRSRRTLLCLRRLRGANRCTVVGVDVAWCRWRVSEGLPAQPPHARRAQRSASKSARKAGGRSKTRRDGLK